MWCLGTEDILLTDVFGEVSCVSAFIPLLLRLDDEKCFRSPVAFVAKGAGEGGRDGILISLSAEVTLVRADEGSAGSDPANGKDPWRLDGRVAELGTAL